MARDPVTEGVVSPGINADGTIRPGFEIHTAMVKLAMGNIHSLEDREGWTLSDIQKRMLGNAQHYRNCMSREWQDRLRMIEMDVKLGNSLEEKGE